MQLMGLPGLPVSWSSSMDVQPALNRACHSNICVLLMLSSPNACLSLPRSPSLFSRDLYKIWYTLAVPLSDPSRNLIRPDTRLRIQGCKKSAPPTPAWNFVHWLPKYASTTIRHCIALLQLLYSMQHQSQKLWIPPHHCQSWSVPVKTFVMSFDSSKQVSTGLTQEMIMVWIFFPYVFTHFICLIIYPLLLY
jgi:hypothetical protein